MSSACARNWSHPRAPRSHACEEWQCACECARVRRMHCALYANAICHAVGILRCLPALSVLITKRVANESRGRCGVSCVHVHQWLQVWRHAVACGDVHWSRCSLLTSAPLAWHPQKINAARVSRIAERHNMTCTVASCVARGSEPSQTPPLPPRVERASPSEVMSSQCSRDRVA